jgi:AraC-like DNA-binding protein
MAATSDQPFRIERTSTNLPIQGSPHHYHDTYEIYYLYSGDRYYFIKDKSYHIQRGDLVLIKPYDVHCTTNFSKSGYDRFLINVKKSYLDGLLELSGGINLFECFEKDIHVVKLNPQEQSYIENLLLAMLSEYCSDNLGHEYFLKTSLVQLLIFASRYSGQMIDDSQSYVSAVHKTVSEVAAYINNNYKEDITLESISDKFFISPFYFSRTFKRVTGVAFTEYLSGIRIKEAKRLISNTDMSMSDIAESVGYKSSTHFGRTFKSMIGMSPSTYKRISRKAAKS